jgi:glycosyltransferase involved in cell wall biosynthesis
MKVAYLVKGIGDASVRYRVLQYESPFLLADIEMSVFVIPKNPYKRYLRFRELMEFDVVVLQRKLLSAASFYYLRRSSRRLIYDFDDAVYLKDSKSPDPHSRTRRKRFIRTVSLSDFIIAGNSIIATEASRINKNTAVLPTPIDVDRYGELKKWGVGEKGFLIGWIGAKSTFLYLEAIRPYLESFSEKAPGTRLKIIADQFFDSKKMDVIKKPWKEDEEVSDLKTLDVGIMPLGDDPWSQGKCGLKMLQYMAAGLPVVCSPVGMNKEAIRDGREGFYASAGEDWIEKLLILYRDRDLRAQMGARGRRKIEKVYSIQANQETYINILKSVAE